MTSRKTYIKPELVSHGTISELTKAGKTRIGPSDGDWLDRPENELSDLYT